MGGTYPYPQHVMYPPGGSQCSNHLKFDVTEAKEVKLNKKQSFGQNAHKFRSCKNLFCHLEG